MNISSVENNHYTQQHANVTKYYNKTIDSA